MKKLLLSTLVVVSAIGYANAQYTKSILVYGNGGYSSSGLYSVSTGLGYQFNKNWTAGGTFGISDMSRGGAPSLIKAHSVGGFLRYTEYFGNENRFFWYAQANVGYFSVLNENRDPGYYFRDTRDGFSASIAPGVGINLPRGFALTFTPASISYTMNNQHSGPGHNRSGELNVGVGGSIFGVMPAFGVTKNFNLGRKKHTTLPSADIAPTSTK